MRWFITALVLCVGSIIFGAPVKSMIGAYGISSVNEESGIVEVEYLESTGTQYILVNSQIDGFDGWLLPGNNNTYGAVGIWNGGARADTIKWTNVQNRGWCFLTGHNNNNVYTYDMTYDFTHVIVDGQLCYVNGNHYQIGAVWGTYFSEYHYFALFGSYHRDGYVNIQSCKIGICKLYYKGELLYDFTPIRYKNEDNRWEGAMYNNVTGELFRNQGTGEFIFGRDI